MKTINKSDLIDHISSTRARSKWSKAVKEDAISLLENIEGEEIAFSDTKNLREQLLNGAKNWSEYSYGGCALIYDEDIAEHYCTTSELKRTHNGERQPNGRESWLDVQARALFQAWLLVKDNAHFLTI